MQYEQQLGFFRTMTAICCTLVFSSVCLLSAVGPVHASPFHSATVSAHMPL